MLKVFAWLLCLLLALLGPVFARDGMHFDIVFVPDSGATDYVATFRQVRAGRQNEPPRTVFQRAGLTRTEISQRNGKEIAFEGRSQSSFITLHVDANGRYRGLQLKLSNGPASPVAQVFRTENVQPFLNETCRIWNITHRIDAHTVILRESCVTDDGIELWHKLLGQSGMLISHIEATGLKRRRVTDLEILPPADLLDLKSWGVTQKSADVPGPADFESTFRHVGAEPGSTSSYQKTVRRHFPWLRTETTTKEHRRVEFEHAVASLRLEFSGERDAVFRYLSVTRYDSLGHADLAAKKLDRTETVLGERCDWFDLYPGVMDANLYQCRASDGIVLKEMRNSRGAFSTIEAVQVKRAPVSAAATAPPEEILRPAYWRIPQ